MLTKTVLLLRGAGCTVFLLGATAMWAQAQTRESLADKLERAAAGNRTIVVPSPKTTTDATTGDTSPSGGNRAKENLYGEEKYQGSRLPESLKK